MITLVENNSLKLAFAENTKTLIFTDNKGYSYNICFEEKNILKSSGTVSCNTASTTCGTSCNTSNISNKLSNLACKVSSCNTASTTGGTSCSCDSITSCESGINIDHYADSVADLSNLTDVKKCDIALIKNTLDLYLYQSSIWSCFGNIKGPQGIQGTKGDEGVGLDIDHIYKNATDLANSSPTLTEGDIIIYSDDGQVLKYTDSQQVKIGTLNLNISNVCKETLIGASLCSTDKEYECIPKSQLRLIDFNDCSCENLVTKCGTSVHLTSGTYKIVYNICWSVTGGSTTDITKYLKNGILTFVYNSGCLIKNSVAYHKSYPITNSSRHEFIISCDTVLELDFVIKVGSLGCLDFCIYSDGSYLEVEKV